jgi:hypothetical protein
MNSKAIDFRRGAFVLSKPSVIALAASLLAAALCAWQLSVHNVLTGVTEYDDGVYLGAALRLVSGVLPYRDYVFVQPPGIAVLMSPIALLGRLVGAKDALVVARLVTALVAALNTGLVAWLVRRWGGFAMAVAGGATATFPLAVTADHTLMLEPYLVLFVLLGSVLAFGEDNPSFRRILFAGACFGIAGSIKIWAAFSFLSLLVCFVPLWRRLLAVVSGAALSFGLLCVPFVIEAPHAFFHEVIADQLSRESSVVNAWPIGSRLVAITGLSGIPSLPSSPTLAVGLLLVLGLLVTVTYVVGRASVRRADVFVLVASLGSIVAMVEAPEFYRHYAYFPLPFLAALLAIALSGSGQVIRRALRHVWSNDHVPRVAGALAFACLGGALSFLVVADVSFASAYLPNVVRGVPGGIDEPAAAIDAAVPPGACVVFDEAILAIEADRFSSSISNCPKVVDPYGMWLADGGGLSPPASPPYPTAFVATWKSYFRAAQYVVLWVPDSDFIPFDPSLLSWFDRHYQLVVKKPGGYVYVQVPVSAGPG